MNRQISFERFCAELLHQPAWPAWVDFFATVRGHQVTPEAALRVEACIGRPYVAGSPVTEATGLVGRRGGKTWHTVAFLLYSILITPPTRKRSEPTWVIAVAQDLRTTRDVILTYAKRLLQDSPVLCAEVEEFRADEIRFRSGMRFTARTSTVASPRGWSIWLALMDEVGYYATSGVETDADIERALRHAQLMFKDRLLLRISTPRIRAGILWRDYQKRTEPGAFCWQASTRVMNPEISDADLAKMRAEDPEGSRREIDAWFVDSISSFFTAEPVLESMRHNYQKMPPKNGVTYHIAIDAAFARDQFAIAVSHRESPERIMVDFVRAWPAPTPVESTLAEVATICREYRVTSPYTDQFSFAVLQALASRHGLNLKQEPWTNESKQSAFGTLRALLNIGNLFLPKDEKLQRELLMLEARALPSGGTRIAAPTSGGYTDDIACAVAMAVSKSEANISQEKYGGGGFILYPTTRKSNLF